MKLLDLKKLRCIPEPLVMWFTPVGPMKWTVVEGVGIPHTGRHVEMIMTMMSSNHNMHCMCLKTRVQLSYAKHWSHTYTFAGL